MSVLLGTDICSLLHTFEVFEAYSRSHAIMMDENCTPGDSLRLSEFWYSGLAGAALG
jgi:hypothetical protein